MSQIPESADQDHLAGSSETGRGYLTGPGLFEFPVDYAVVGGHAIHEGCIDLGPVEEVEREAQRINAANENRKTTEAAGGDDNAAGPGSPNVALGVGLPTTSGFLWTNGVVPYTIRSNVPNQGRVTDAINHIHANTAIRFVQRTNQTNYVEIISNGNEGWSSSSIGMRGNRQFVKFSDRHGWQILVHEFLHALGVYHEQSRSDRDNFVEIKWDNIKDGPPPAGEINAIGNFQKKSGATDYFDYDYGSIMHYPGTSFAKDFSKPTIVPKQSGVTIGQRQKMSHGDRQTVAKMYERFFARGYAGVWRSGSGRYGLWVNASWSSFRAKWQEWSRQGLRLHDIHVRKVGNTTRYSGVFLPGSGRYALWANVTWSSFRSKWQEWSAQGLRLVDLHVHRSRGQNRYSGVFLAGNGGHALWVNSSWSSFQSKWREWSQRGLRLTDVHVHRYGGQRRYSGVFRAGSGGYALWANASWSSFVSKWQQWSSQGLRLVDVNLHKQGSDTRYTGAFVAGTGSHYLWANVTWESFRAKWQELGEQGLRLIDFEIANPDGGNAADFADHPGDEMDAADESLELAEFGGIFGEDPAPEEPSNEEGGGGVGDTQNTRLPVSSESEDGGVFFADATPIPGYTDESPDGESADGDGAAVLDESSFVDSVEDGDQGGVHLL